MKLQPGFSKSGLILLSLCLFGCNSTFEQVQGQAESRLSIGSSSLNSESCAHEIDAGEACIKLERLELALSKIDGVTSVKIQIHPTQYN